MANVPPIKYNSLSDIGPLKLGDELIFIRAGKPVISSTDTILNFVINNITGYSLLGSSGATGATGSTGSVVSASPVTNISVTSVTTNSIAISFTPPSSGTIVWNYRVHNTSTWTPYNTAFSGNSGIFTGLNSNIVYDIQAVVTLNGTTASTELDNITTQSTTPVNASTTFASITAFDINQTFSRDANANNGNPAGYSTTYNSGWATIPFVVTLKNAGNGTPQIRLRDNANPGTYASPGTIIQDWITIAGAPTTYTTAATTINALIPASKKGYIVDIAFSGDLTNGITSINPIWVGVNIMIFGQSIATSFFDAYGYTYTNSYDLSTLWTPEPCIHQLSMGNNSPNNNGLAALGSQTWAKTDPIANGSYSRTTMGEFYNKVSDRENCAVGVLGYHLNGTIISTFDPNISNASDGRESSGWNALEQILNRAGNIDYLIICGCNSNTDSGPYNNATPGEYAIRILNIIEAIKLMVTKPFYISNVLTYTTDDNPNRHAFNSEVKRRVLPKYGALARSFAGKLNTQGGDPNAGGHPSWLQRREVGYNYAREWAELSGRTNTSAPKIVSATRAAGSADIIFTVTNSGTALSGHWLRTTDGNTYPLVDMSSSLTPASLYTGFAVFPVTGGQLTGSLALSGAYIMSATQIKLTLAAVPTGPLECWYYSANYPVDSNTGDGAITIRDNNIDDNIPYGRQLQTNIDPIYVPDPANQSATAVVISSVNNGNNTQSGAKTKFIGTWDGALPPTLIEYNVDGGAWQSSVEMVIVTNKTWSAAFTTPSNIGSHTIQVRTNGILSNTVTFTSVAVDSPMTNIKFEFDSRIVSTMFTDTARTSVATDFSLIKAIADNSGNGNHFYAPDRTPRLYFGLRNSLPGLVFSPNTADGRYSPPSGHRLMYLLSVSGATLQTSLFNKSFSMLVVTMEEGDGVVFGANNSTNNISTQNLIVGTNNNGPAVRRDNTPSNSLNNAFDSGTLTDTTVNYAFKIKKTFIRFDVNAKTLKLKTSGNAEVSMAVTADTTIYAAWDQCTIGLFYAYGTTGLNGSLYRLAVAPNYVATDVERDNTLTYADNLYGF